MSLERKEILLLDDDNVLRKRLAKAFSERGFSVSEFSNVADVLSHQFESDLEYAVLDLFVGKESGADLIEPLKKQFPKIKILILTGYGSIVSAVDAVKRGAANYISKPVNLEMILEAFEVEKGLIYSEGPKENSIPGLKNVEWEYIQRIMSYCNGNISRAAKLLGIHRRSLQRKLSRE